MNFGPLARIILRYGVGFVIGSEIGEQLSMDADIVAAVAIAIGVGVEAVYAYAKKNGGKT